MDTNQIVMANDTSSAAAEKVVANDHLLSEILRRLPIRSLFRFKSVCRHWFSLIADDPQLGLRKNPDPSSVSGLFLYPSFIGFRFWNKYTEMDNPGLDFLPFYSEKVPPDPTFIPNLSGLIILSPCHELLCCLGYNEIDQKGGYHIVNPTTKQFITLPDPHLDGFDGLNLAFDPSRSPFYKVVNIWHTFETLLVNPNVSQTKFQIEVYSSETRSWRSTGEPFTVHVGYINFSGGIFWNGALHWFPDVGDGFYFHVEQERLGRVPEVPEREGMAWYDRSVMSPVVARDHFHVIEIYGSTGSQIDVYEMEKDYSGWFVKYKVDLDSVVAAFPQMGPILSAGRQHEAYSVLSLVGDENDEEWFLVLHVPGKIIRYNLVNKSFGIIQDVGMNETSLRYFSAIHYIESYANV
ncbi:F-box protein At5g07610-like [Diospyros lotus]|uniref:F-box protein At5g07610-like n=1 Tax=Diospyros lotus TaxID=55363 RepID=UPI00225691F3|nr:F-box protein At5g07610-like [Diospyros lotus]